FGSTRLMTDGHRRFTPTTLGFGTSLHLTFSAKKFFQRYQRGSPMDSPRHSQTAGSPSAPAEEHLLLRVLIVEDHADTAATTAMLLRLCGHDCQIAPSGEAALQAVATYQPDVVLLDIGLPGLNGLEVARRLREQAGCRRPFLIAITGYDRDEDSRRSSDAV